MWSAARYETVADRLAPLAEVLLDEVEDRLGSLRGRRLLDVGAGTGNVALAAAHRGAHVTALDPAPRLLAVAAERAATQGVDLRTVTGTAEDMADEDITGGGGTFDAVVSCLGVIFASDRAAAAAAMRRVASPGGVVSVLAWQPAPPDDPFLAPIVAALGTPPPGTPSPIDWGVPEVARDLLGAGGGDLTHRSDEHRWEFTDIDDGLRFLDDSPVHNAVLSGVDEAGRDRYRRAAAEAFERHAVGARPVVRSPYLVTTVRLPGDLPRAASRQEP
jgi:SAM-dependent methyltransferase